VVFLARMFDHQLARTGSETWLVALAGGGFLLAGLGLRLRLRGRPE